MEEGRLLDVCELRVLGVLLEKEQTTPDSYPLTIHQTIAGCNQKSNRDPVVEMTETEVVEALDRLRLEVLTWRTEGARVEKWEHSVTRRWHLVPRRKAVLTLLLLRGPQTSGELKARSERMHSFATKEEVEDTLREMAEGPEALVSEAARIPGKRGRRWQHLLGVVEAVETPASAAPESLPSYVPPPVERGPSAIDRLEALETKVDTLGDGVQRIQEALDRLQKELGIN